MIEDRTRCTWEEDTDGNYWTECNQGSVFEDGGPEENGYKFCPYCGLALIVTAWVDDEEE